jgi:hypothetical protein
VQRVGSAGEAADLRSRRALLRGLAAGAVCGIAAGRGATAAVGGKVGMAEPPPAAHLFDRYGFDEEARRRVDAGDIVARQLPSTRPQQMSVASALLLPQPLAVVADHFADVTFYPPDPDLRASGLFDASGVRVAGHDGHGAIFAAADGAEIDRLHAVEAGSAFNLSSAEIARIRRRLAGARAADGAADAAAANAAFAAVLTERAAAYAADGLAAIAPYDRGDGREQRPGAALRADGEAFDAEFTPYLGNLRRALAAHPQPPPATVASRLFWRKTLIDGRLGHQVMHLLITGGDGWLATATRQIYVSHSYDCLQAIAVFYDLGNRSLLIDANTTTTDQIPALFGALARRLGGDALRRTLIRHFAALTTRLTDVR